MSATAGEYLLLWKGQQSGPFEVDKIREKLRVGEISRIHQIGGGGGWQLLDEFLETIREAEIETQRADEQKRREEDLSRRYEAQLAEERSKRAAATQKLQELTDKADEDRRAGVQSTQSQAPTGPLPAPPPFTPTMSHGAAQPAGGTSGQAPGAPPPAFAPAGGGMPRSFGTPPPPFVGLPTRTSGLAVASLVMGICCFIPFVNGISSILALAFGHIALSRMKDDRTLGGRGMALAGLIITYILLALGILLIVATVGSGKSVKDLL